MPARSVSMLAQVITASACAELSAIAGSGPAASAGAAPENDAPDPLQPESANTAASHAVLLRPIPAPNVAALAPPSPRGARTST